MKYKTLTLLLYEFLTFLITFLGWIRQKIERELSLTLRTERISFHKPPLLLQCCDCGLIHWLGLKEDKLVIVPERPLEYRYKLRWIS